MLVIGPRSDGQFEVIMLSLANDRQLVSFLSDSMPTFAPLSKHEPPTITQPQAT